MIKQVQIPSTRLSSETTIATKGRHSCPRVRNPFSALARNLGLGSDGEVAVLARETQRHHFPFITQNISQVLQPPEPAAQIDFETNPIPDLHLNEGLERGYTL